MLPGKGLGSRSVRWRVPALMGAPLGDEWGEARVRWHSFNMVGMEELGRREGRAKAWMDVKRPGAKGSLGVGDGTEKGWMFGCDVGERGLVERWCVSVVGLEADRKDADAG